ncbi:MAG TPA: hypothetical protein VFE62_03465 [Gemmataceae bacterium]|nr:hypothetical protein [Gemmataceae bacterium]
MRFVRVLMMIGLLATATTVRAQAPSPVLPAPLAAQPACQAGGCAPYRPVADGPPRVNWKRGCPRPICNPSDPPQCDYYDSCWKAWPYPANWTKSPPPSVGTPASVAPWSQPAPPSKR